ncbi:hypothetical protein [Clostridium estertheticum]|nr:hypothetical protein [Clostridium estertheticum]MBU3186555.1 hypothetical protein [Clostridium estertheticum]
MKKVLRDRETDYGMVGEETLFRSENGRILYVGDVVETISNDSGRSAR